MACQATPTKRMKRYNFERAGRVARGPLGIGCWRRRVTTMFAGRRKAASIPPIEKMPQSMASKRACFDFRLFFHPAERI